VWHFGKYKLPMAQLAKARDCKLNEKNGMYKGQLAPGKLCSRTREASHSMAFPPCEPAGSGGSPPRKARFSYAAERTEAQTHVESTGCWSCTSDSTPSEARKRGSGGGYPRKYDDLLTVPKELDLQTTGCWSCVFL
jgi:hypothetical protein